MSLFLKHNSNASVRLSWSHSSTHLPSQSALTSLSTCSGLSKHFLLLAVALLGLPCNRKSNCYGLFLRTALSSVLMFSPTVFLPYPFFNGMSNLLFGPFGQNACKPPQAPGRKSTSPASYPPVTSSSTSVLASTFSKGCPCTSCGCSLPNPEVLGGETPVCPVLPLSYIAQ